MRFPVFLTVVLVVRNQSARLRELLESVVVGVSGVVNDFEILIVDNASQDDSIGVLKTLTGDDGLPNLQVFALSGMVDRDTATCAGLENSLGDFVAIVDPLEDDVAFLPQMLERAVVGADIVFAANLHRPPESLAYRVGRALFETLYRGLEGGRMVGEVPPFRILSRRIVNFILQFPQPALTYRHLPAASGFARVHLQYQSPPRLAQGKRLRDAIDRAMRLLVSTTRAPMRLVTSLSLFGAVANLVYSLYVVAVAVFKTDVAPGWVSLSLQQSGMFFLISLVLLVLGEYIVQMASLSQSGPLYHVAQEFTSARLSRHDRLNVEEAAGDRAVVAPVV